MSFSINAVRTALVVMDFQPSIQASLSNADEVTEAAARAACASRDAGARVVAVRVAFTRDELAAFPPHSAMGQRMNAVADKVLVEAPTTQVDPRLGMRADEMSFRKCRVGPFSTTDLSAELRRAGVDTVVLAGIHTSGCVLSAVREAHDQDFRVVVLSDACADPDPLMHEFLMSRVFPKQAEVVSTVRYATAIGSKAA